MHHPRAGPNNRSSGVRPRSGSAHNGDHCTCLTNRSVICITPNGQRMSDNGCCPIWPLRLLQPPQPHARTDQADKLGPFDAGLLSSEHLESDPLIRESPCDSIPMNQALVVAGVVSATVNGGAAPAGRRTVKVEPSPGALVAVISPPISRHSLRLITSPSPDPPNCRAVDASAWLNSRNKRPSCYSVMPIRVSETAKSIQC